MNNTSMKAVSFFDEEPTLQRRTTTTAITYTSGSIAQILNTCSITGKVIAYSMNELKFGYFTENTCIFADGKPLDEPYLLQLRIFNDNGEILLQKDGSTFQMRHIQDAAEQGKETEYIDIVSPLLGDRNAGAQVPPHFACLFEQGRKISMTIPTDETAKNYLLKTRNYITYDKKTGQAGYGFWRFVDIKAR